MREYAAANREPLVRLGLGGVIAWLSLRLLSKTYENAHVTAESARLAATSRAILDVHESPAWLSATADAIAQAPPASRATTLRDHLATARVDAAEAVQRGAANGSSVRNASALASALESAPAARAPVPAPPPPPSLVSPKALTADAPVPVIRRGII